MLDINNSGVYFVLNVKNNLIKIGCSRNILNRFNQLVSEIKLHGKDNEQYKLIEYINCDKYYKLEKYLHDCYKYKKVAGEWYRLSNEDIKYIIFNLDLNKFN